MTTTWEFRYCTTCEFMTEHEKKNPPWHIWKCCNEDEHRTIMDEKNKLPNDAFDAEDTTNVDRVLEGGENMLIAIGNNIHVDHHMLKAIAKRMGVDRSELTTGHVKAFSQKLQKHMDSVCRSWASELKELGTAIELTQYDQD